MTLLPSDEVLAFLITEARYADESALDEWEALLTDDFHYWVPNGPMQGDPAKQLSYINDNRARTATRIRQLKTGKRLAQLPPSPMRRVLSNIEVREIIGSTADGSTADGSTADGSAAGDEQVVEANVVLYEVAAQSTGELRIWPSRVRYRLRRVGGELRLAAKWVELVTAELGQRNLTFLI
ncbi:MAG: benzoate/toluate 1,2-dioxygenase beta subunit [Acidimicrobiales bacterium]|jgi:benzoate/toluate 1,2-dioxygenase beta subunit